MIAAVLANGVIGADGDQPWSHPDDFRRFRQLTTGGVLIMGRRTYQAIGRPLPGRRTLVLSRDRRWQPGAAGDDQVRVVGDLDQALSLATTWCPGAILWIAGGGEIYRQAMGRCDRLEITEVAAALPGDVTFPPVDPEVWIETDRISRPGFDWVTRHRRDVWSGSHERGTGAATPRLG